MRVDDAARAWIFSATLFFALSAFTSTVYWLGSVGPQVSLIARSIIIFVATYLIARQMVIRHAISIPGLFASWYVGTQLGWITGALRFGTQMISTLLPTVLSLGILPQDEMDSTPLIISNALLIAVLFLGYRSGSRVALESTELR